MSMKYGSTKYLGRNAISEVKNEMNWNKKIKALCFQK